MYLTPQWNYGSGFGIYCYQEDTEEVAEQALYSCRNGGDNARSRLPRTDTAREGWAVEFGYPPRIRG